MHRYDARRRALAFGIAGLAGFVDATGFLAANSYFFSFMSGNTTRLGVDIATNGIQALIPALLILGFIAGVTLGSLVAHRFSRRRKTAVLGFAATLLLAAAITRGIGGENLFVAFSVLAMGAVNNAFAREGEATFGVTYMTGALVRFGQGLAGWLLGQKREGWVLNFLLWASLALGAIAGATIASRASSLSVWIAVAGAFLLTLCAWLLERRGAQGQSS